MGDHWRLQDSGRDREKEKEKDKRSLVDRLQDKESKDREKPSREKSLPPGDKSPRFVTNFKYFF